MHAVINLWLLNPAPAPLQLGSFCCQSNSRRWSLLIESKQDALIAEALKTIKQVPSNRDGRLIIKGAGCKQIVEIEICSIDTGKVVLTDINI